MDRRALYDLAAKAPIILVYSSRENVTVLFWKLKELHINEENPNWIPRGTMLIATVVANIHRSSQFSRRYEKD